ncbi:MAG: polyphenol oxidase family protein [Pseudomonadota bacterium]|nr:polyphenol oxidase family protein [Pseudomonadota bacterium]
MYASTLLSPTLHAFTGVRDGDHRAGADGDAAARLLAALDTVGPVRVVSQVHGARVVRAEDASPAVEADAILSTLPGVVVAVRVADCVPILMSAPGAVAAVHAGWRGTAADIARAALAAVCEAAGCAPTEVRAAIGPSICGACYQVGDDVLDAVARVAPGAGWRVGERNVDLGEANAAILRGEGVRVDRLPYCTRCGEGFWSYRRDGAAGGRQVGAIRL